MGYSQTRSKRNCERVRERTAVDLSVCSNRGETRSAHSSSRGTCKSTRHGIADARPTLEAEYRRFFAMTTAEKMGVPLSCLSLYLMICSLGAYHVETRLNRRMRHACIKVGDLWPPQSRSRKAGAASRSQPQRPQGSYLQSSPERVILYVERVRLPLTPVSAAYQALRLCSFMSNPTIYTIQTQILMNIYLLNSERAADGWAQTGSLIRQCVAMGLHVDPASLDPRISMRDAEVRRRIWWSVAGLDALFCVSFGRPSAINFYTTNLPQDRTDDNLSDAPGSALSQLPPSNVLRNETTDVTYHAAYFQLTIPSFELLDRIFRVDWKYSRSSIYGWFSKPPQGIDHPRSFEETHTYGMPFASLKTCSRGTPTSPAGCGSSRTRIRRSRSYDPGRRYGSTRPWVSA